MAPDGKGPPISDEHLRAPLRRGSFYVRFSNRPFGVKHFQASHHASVDVTHGLVLLFGIGTKALPSWDSKTRWNNLSGGLAVSVTAGPSGRSISPHPSVLAGTRSDIWAPRKIAPTCRAPQNCLRMIPLRSPSDSLTFARSLSAIGTEGNFSRCPSDAWLNDRV